MRCVLKRLEIISDRAEECYPRHGQVRGRWTTRKRVSPVIEISTDTIVVRNLHVSAACKTPGRAGL